MTIGRTTEYLRSLLNEQRKLPRETEWVEFKHNNDDLAKIENYLARLASCPG